MPYMDSSWQRYVELNRDVRFVYVWRDQVKEMLDSLFESSDEVHAPGKQQVHLVRQHGVDDLPGHIVWIQHWEQSWPPERDEKKNQSQPPSAAVTSITAFLTHAPGSPGSQEEASTLLAS